MMDHRLRLTALSGLILLLLGLGLLGAENPREFAIEGNWVRPAESHPALPVWGHAKGIRVGLWPTLGPRGLLRVYAPYLGHVDDRMINYIAVEPIVRGSNRRGFSELEQSRLDGVQGLRFWSADDPRDPMPRAPDAPARGRIGLEEGVETLTVYILIEPYRNGAHVFLRLRFRADRPHEVGIATYVHDDSAPLETCVVTATMGNFARLRVLHLRSRDVHADDLWPGFDGPGFARHVCFEREDMIHTPSGDILFVATPDEENPSSATYAPGTFIGWEYYGEVATQFWRHENPPADLTGCVNARAQYWASDAPIPGGASFENFELIAPFQNGAEAWFGIEPGVYERNQLVQSVGSP